ncbi:MAG: DUF4136 domain-containing protein [Cyclobacteriaceae bacterium]|nr:DUF4136 domain-containing protein [Cyclobacteriaceae bacterium]MDX5468048.1 DUF4136 domain-containing protein [Cyclobacteriaceae bacterium]
MKNIVKYAFVFILLNFLFIPMVISQTVHTDDRRGVDWSEYKTYDWVFDKDLIPGDQVFMSEDIMLVYNNVSTRKMVKDAVETQMKAKGFAHMEADPDMLVNFIIIEEPTELRTFTPYNGFTYLNFGPKSIKEKMVPVEEGTVLVNISDAHTGLMLWQGFVSGAFDDKNMNNLSQLQAEVISMFQEWDVNVTEE